MNRRLIDPFQAMQLPETIEDFLEHGRAKCLAFNRRGTLLAVGTWDGWVILVDWDTRSPASSLSRHTSTVMGLSWSRNGRYLASVGWDSQLVLWNVLEGTVEMEVSLPAQAVHVCLSPRPPYKALVSLVDGPPLLLDLNTGQEQRLPVLGEADLSKAGAAVKEGAPVGVLACFTKNAEAIVVGHTRAPGGVLYVLDTATLSFLDVVKVSQGARVLGLSLNRQGTLLLANCHDRALRLFDVATGALPGGGKQGSDIGGNGGGSGGGATAKRGTTPPAAASAAPAPLLSLEEVRAQLQNLDFKAAKAGSLLGGGGQGGVLQLSREFKNAVDRVSWAGACFSADSDYLASAAASQTHHHIHIWSRMYGKLERILEGPKEGTGAVTWHPLRSCLCSVSGLEGRVLLWERAYHEQWSAFAPDFKELDENAEYVEHEDEFDWQTPGATGHHDVLLARERQSGNGAAAAAAAAARSGGGASTAAGAAVNGAAAAAAGQLLLDGEEVLDIVTVEPDYAFTSDDEDPPGEQLHYLPVELAPLEELRGPADDDPDGAMPSEDGGGGASEPGAAARLPTTPTPPPEAMT